MKAKKLTDAELARILVVTSDVAATPAISAGALASGGAGSMGAASYTGGDIEAAMVVAIKHAHAEGITDPVKVRALMMAARKDILKQAIIGTHS